MKSSPSDRPQSACPGSIEVLGDTSNGAGIGINGGFGLALTLGRF